MSKHGLASPADPVEILDAPVPGKVFAEAIANSQFLFGTHDHCGNQYALWTDDGLYIYEPNADGGISVPHPDARDRSFADSVWLMNESISRQQQEAEALKKLAAIAGLTVNASIAFVGAQHPDY